MLVDLDGKAFMANVIEIPGGTDPAYLGVVVDVGARFNALNEAQMMVLYGIIGLLVIGLVLSMLLSGAKVDEQIARLRDSVHLMAEGNGYILDPDKYTGVYHELARDLRRVGESGSPGAAAPQAPESEPPEEVRTDSGSLDFESLLGDGGPEPANAIPQDGPPSEPSLEDFAPEPFEATPVPAPEPLEVTPVPAPPTDQKGPTVDMPGDLASFFDEGDKEPESTEEIAEPDAPWAGEQLEPAPTASPSQPAGGEEMVSAPPPHPLSGGMDLAHIPEFVDDEDRLEAPEYGSDATVIAQVPEELLNIAATDSADPSAPEASSVPPPPTVLPRPPVVATAVPTTPPASETDVHFHEVFEQFIQTKKQCGEPVAGLTANKFVEKLRKNSSALKARYRCNSVKFQVYVKNGKAALKATPIK